MKGHPATVIEVDGQTLVAMTEFGRKFNVRNKYGLKIGDPILVMFDIRNNIINNMPIQMRDEISEITDVSPESESEFLRPSLDASPYQDADTEASFDPFLEDSESESEVLRPFYDETSSQDPFHPVTDEWSDDEIDSFLDSFI